jgi:hypothetical protein
MTGTSLVEGFLIDWAQSPAEPDFRLPADWLDDTQVAAELAHIERRRARDAAREAALILRLAALRPDTDDPPPSTPGARRTWRRTEPEFPGVCEFFTAEVAHALNLGRGTAAFRARRAFTWAESLPATLAALAGGELDERRAGVLADVLQHTQPDLARQVEARVLPGAGDLSPAALRRAALAVLAELDAEAIQQRHEEAKKAADVRAYQTHDGMAALAADLTAEQAAACYAVLDALAAMAKADGDERPIGAIRAAMMAMLIMRPADHGLGGVQVQLAVTATLEALEGAGTVAGEVNGFTISAAQLRDLLRRVGALGLTAPDGGSLSFALTDPHGRLLATATPTDLARAAAHDCADHPGQPNAPHPDGTQAEAEQPEADVPEADRLGSRPSAAKRSAATPQDTEQSASDPPDLDPGCDCPVLGPPAPTDRYQPTPAQRRFTTTRDRRCRMPNCGQRVGWADLDHVLPHGQGGATCCINLCCLCRSHHRLKTFAPGWTFHLDPDGTLHVTSPSGVTRTTRPPGLRPPPEPPPDDPANDPADDPPPF